jgi:hypothetical protein
MARPDPRRALSLETLDDVMPEVDRLLAGGYRPAGNWSLGQICHHLADTFRVTLDGPPRPMPWVVKKTIGPLALRWLKSVRRMPVGLKAPSYLTPPASSEAEDRPGAENLRAVIARFQNELPETIDHPLFGRVSRADLATISVRHCEHHLAFAIPTTPTTDEQHEQKVKP